MDVFSRVPSFIGRKVSKLYRIHYVYREKVDKTVGPLQILFQDGSFCLFDVSSDGEHPKLLLDKWRDPFAEPLDEKNAKYVREHGKWVEVDVTSDPDYSRFINKELTSIYDIRTKSGDLVGMRFHFDSQKLTFIVGADEAWVFPNAAEGELQKRELIIGDNKKQH